VKAFLAVPNYDGTVSAETMLSVMHASRGIKTTVYSQHSSLLAYGFNMTWVVAVESGFDYFAMIHADIGAPAHWLSDMVDMMEAEKAEVVSAVVPIKDDSFTVSTAWDRGDDAVRLTYDEVRGLPATFSAEDLGEKIAPENKGLLVNTGLWVAKLGRDWNRKFTGFRINTGIYWDRKAVWVEPEDWEFSRQMNRMGEKIMATSAVKVQHTGKMVWNIPGSRSGEEA